MRRKLTITLDEEVYLGLHRHIGKRKISQFIEDLTRPHVIDADLELAYKEMAADEERERQAVEWVEGVVGDVAADEPR
jgi:predicted CopG family antitoxin